MIIKQPISSGGVFNPPLLFTDTFPICKVDFFYELLAFSAKNRYLCNAIASALFRSLIG